MSKDTKANIVLVGIIISFVLLMFGIMRWKVTESQEIFLNEMKERNCKQTHTMIAAHETMKKKCWTCPSDERLHCE